MSYVYALAAAVSLTTILARRPCVTTWLGGWAALALGVGLAGLGRLSPTLGRWYVEWRLGTR